MDNSKRIARFTSSQIWKLMTSNPAGKAFGAPGKTYIKEKQIELRLGRAVEINRDGRASLWGTFMQQRVHDLLPTKYVMDEKETIVHPIFPFWSGTPDNIIVEESTVGDIKCYEPKNFALYVDALTEANENGNCDNLIKSHEAEYWQLISNACITNSDFIEAIVYMPYESELPIIKEMAANYNESDQYKYRFIYESPKNELPYLPDDSGYKNLNVFRFAADPEHKIALTNRLQLAFTHLYPGEILQSQLNESLNVEA